MLHPSKKHKLVVDTLKAAKGPMSANELWEQLRDSRSGIGIATVYRALNRGVEEGELASVEIQSGSVRYEPTGLAHHHHFLCSQCERAFDVEGCVRSLHRLLPAGFEMTGHEILLHGRCSGCRGKQ